MSKDFLNNDNLNIEHQEENVNDDSLLDVFSSDDTRGSGAVYEDEQSPFDMVDKYDLLTKEEEESFAKRAHNGDKDAVEQLVLHNMRLVRSFVTKNCKGLPKQDQEDAFQEGIIGLTNAANKYELKKGTRFSTYATIWIKKYVQNYLFKKSNLSLSETQHSNLYKFYRAKAELEEELIKSGESFSTPSIHDIAVKMNIKEDEAQDLWEMYLEENQTSLNQTISQDSDEVSIIDQIEYQEGETPEYLFAENEANEKLLSAISKLDEKHRFVVERTLGVNGKPQMSNVEIAKQLRISAERVRQLAREAEKMILKIAEN